MATETKSVVTPERYEQGVSYEQWMKEIDRNQDKFVENYEGFEPDEKDVAAIKAIVDKGVTKCLVIGEPWCPDVYRGMPPMQKIAERTGLELKIFFRDKNIDIMNEFLKRGEFQSIPVFVFYTKDHEYVGHWIERAAPVKGEMPALQAIQAKLREPDISEEDKAKATAELNAFYNGSVWRGWQTYQVTEIRELLENNFKD